MVRHLLLAVRTLATCDLLPPFTVLLFTSSSALHRAYVSYRHHLYMAIKKIAPRFRVSRSQWMVVTIRMPFLGFASIATRADDNEQFSRSTSAVDTQVF